jgi:hypothetical protein
MSMAVAVEGATARPLARHPGNIYLRGEQVEIRLDEPDRAWRLVDYDGNEKARGFATNGRALPGRLPVGWYELKTAVQTNWIGVIGEPPSELSPDSPLSLDLALAWRVPSSNWNAAVNLARLAGASWVRDRIGWGELETANHWFADHTRYDDAIRAATKAGLRVLEVNHQAPEWAGTNTTRFPEDLRAVFEFYKHVGSRWKGSVRAVEPWNEADIDVFGGHIGSEIATFQKAAWLGLKAGNPDLLVCQNVFALAQPSIMKDFRANATDPYYETFNFHHYVPPDEYPALYRDFKKSAGGRPLWTTEANWPLHWSDFTTQELSRDDLREQSERVAKVAASAMAEGAAHVFYFVLPHYSEGATQFGLLRPDLSPRPGYVALAAAGRFLADARAMGRLPLPKGAVALAFKIRLEAKERETVVAWATTNTIRWDLPARPLAVYDHLGREIPLSGGDSPELDVSWAPVYAIFARGALRNAPLQPPPPLSPRAAGTPCPVVLQAVWPADECVRSRSALRLPSDRRQDIPLNVYNFGSKSASGILRLPPHSPAVLGLRRGTNTEPRSEIAVSLRPNERCPLSLVVDARHHGMDW